jgi:hypothetical protein
MNLWVVKNKGGVTQEPQPQKKWKGWDNRKNNKGEIIRDNRKGEILKDNNKGGILRDNSKGEIIWDNNKGKILRDNNRFNKGEIVNFNRENNEMILIDELIKCLYTDKWN